MPDLPPPDLRRAINRVPRFTPTARSIWRRRPAAAWAATGAATTRRLRSICSVAPTRPCEPWARTDQHLSALHKVSAPVACNECHLVPTAVSTVRVTSTLPPPAEVFPPGAGVLAGADGTPLAYDTATVTCTTYCHGSGALLSQDTSPSINRTPVWNGGPGQVACGTCHGIPPQMPGTTYHVGVTSTHPVRGLPPEFRHPGREHHRGCLRQVHPPERHSRRALSAAGRRPPPGAPSLRRPPWLTSGTGR